MKKNKLLIASLLINAFLVGVLVSHTSFLRMERHRPHHPPIMGHKIKKVANELPVEYRSKVKDIIDNYDPKVRGRMENMRSTLDEIREVLIAEKFDEAKFIQLTSKIDPNEQKIKKNMSAMILNIAKTLPDEHRIKFFKNMKKRRIKSPDFKRPRCSRDRKPPPPPLL